MINKFIVPRSKNVKYVNDHFNKGMVVEIKGEFPPGF